MNNERFKWLESQLGDFNFLLKSTEYVSAMDLALDQVKHRFRNRQNQIIPGTNDVFAAFKNCNLRRLKVVVVANSPYPTFTNIDKPLASGYAYGIREKVTPIPLALRNIISAVDLMYGSDPSYTINRLTTNPANLWGKNLAAGGVLLMNYQLVTDCYDPMWSTNQRVFDRVSSITVDMIRSRFPTVLWMLPKSLPIWDIIPETRKIEFNPTDDNFILSGVFQKANDYLIRNGESTVQW